MIPLNKQSQEVCKSASLENVDMVSEVLQNKAKAEKLETADYQKTSNVDLIWKKTVCDMYNEDCIREKPESYTSISVGKRSI